MKNYQNILVIRTDRIGDVVLTTPAVKALREAFPECRITLLVAPATRELIDKNPYINEVMLDDRRGAHRGITGFWRLARELRLKKFDLAVVYHTKRRTNLLCALAGIPQRLGFRNNKYGFLLNIPVVDERHLGKKHEAAYCLDLLKAIGIESGERETHVSLHLENERWAGELLRKNNIDPSKKLIAVHAGASDPSKQWPVEYFVEAMDRISDRYPVHFLLIGDRSVRPLAQQILQKSRAVLSDMTGQTSLGQLASLLARCSLLISNDSGPVHVAAGLRTPVVSIFTRNQRGINPERWAPLEPRSRVVSVPFDPEPSFLKAGSVSPGYLRLIAPDTLLEAVDAVFKLC